LFFSDEGGGRYGHLRLIMVNVEYFAVSTDVFPLLINPGAVATMVAGMMADQIMETDRVHTEATRIYHTYNTTMWTKPSTNKMIIDACFGRPVS
jgi:hypothetical protein